MEKVKSEKSVSDHYTHFTRLSPERNGSHTLHGNNCNQIIVVFPVCSVFISDCEEFDSMTVKGLGQAVKTPWQERIETSTYLFSWELQGILVFPGGSSSVALRRIPSVHMRQSSSPPEKIRQAATKQLAFLLIKAIPCGDIIWISLHATR